MCHNYLGGMYLRTFSKKPAPDTVSSYGYIIKKCLFKQVIGTPLFLYITKKTIKTNIQQTMQIEFQ